MQTLTNIQLTLLTSLKTHLSSKAFARRFYQLSEFTIVKVRKFGIVNLFCLINVHNL
jgi:hypothetical protein